MPQGDSRPSVDFGEIDARRRLAVDIDQREVRQVFGEGPEQQAFLLHGAEILAIDPDEIDAAVGLAGLHLVAHPRAPLPPCR